MRAGCSYVRSSAEDCGRQSSLAGVAAVTSGAVFRMSTPAVEVRCLYELAEVEVVEREAHQHSPWVSWAGWVAVMGHHVEPLTVGVGCRGRLRILLAKSSCGGLGDRSPWVLLGAMNGSEVNHGESCS